MTYLPRPPWIGYAASMSIWKRIGEALSALAAGEGLSDVFAKLKTPPEKSIGFTIAVIALGAKLAKADGQVTKDEVSAFRHVFTIPPGEEANAARVYNLARNDIAGYDGYARQIARMFGPGDKALEDILDGLFYIALADGEYHPGEKDFLEDVAHVFGIGNECFTRLRARHWQDMSDPYAVLGVKPGDDPKAIRRKWRDLVQINHPDRVIARGVPPEAVKLAEKRLAEINDAYEEINRQLAA